MNVINLNVTQIRNVQFHDTPIQWVLPAKKEQHALLAIMRDKMRLAVYTMRRSSRPILEFLSCVVVDQKLLHHHIMV